MKQRYLIFLLLLLTLAIACGEARPTPTPFAEDNVTEEALDLVEPLALSITDLAADPEAYANRFVEITGQYRRLPLLVCDTDPHPAPATWQLAATDGSTVAIGGFGSQVRSLLPNDLTMTVVGVWQRFDGPVGCGKSATNTEIWYLKARDIVSPSPIARVTLTPTGSGTQIAEVDEGTAVSNPQDNNFTATPTRSEEGGEPVETPTLASTSIPAPPGSGTPTTTAATPTEGSEEGAVTSTPSPTRDGDTSIGTPTTTSGTNGTATPTTSSGSGTPTPTGSSGSNPTPTTSALTTATRDPIDFDTVTFDPIGPEQPILEILEAEQAHLYPVLFDYNGAITITAIAEPTVDLVLEIMDPTNAVVQQANSTGNGGLESIINAQLNVALDYEIRVYNLNNNEGDYCLIFNEGGGFPDTIKGRIDYGQTVTDQVEVLGIDYWCFLGASGDNVTVTSAATGNSGDFVVGLFGPPSFDSIGAVFQDPEIANESLKENGMYMIGVLDFEAGASGYTLTLTKN